MCTRQNMGPISGPRSPQAPSLHTVSQGVGGRGTATRRPATGPGRTLLFALGPVKPTISLRPIPETARPRHSLCRRSFVWSCGPVAQSRVGSRVWPLGWASPTRTDPPKTQRPRVSSEVSALDPGAVPARHSLTLVTDPNPRLLQALPPRPGAPQLPSGSEPPCSGVQVGQDRPGLRCLWGKKGSL